MFQIPQILSISCFLIMSNSCFWSNFEQYSVLVISPWNQKLQKWFQKIAMLWIPRQFYYWLVAESTYNSQNAQFGFVM